MTQPYPQSHPIDRERSLLNRVVSPLLLFLCPPFVLLVWYTLRHLEGSLLKLIDFVARLGWAGTWRRIFAPVWLGDRVAWTSIAVFAAFQLLFMIALPGRWVEGPPAPSGAVPRYKANGVPAFLATLCLYVLASSWGVGLFPASIVYDHFGAFLGALNLSALLLCALLYVKGRWFPSSADAGSSGSLLFDYYWGMELYPRIGPWDIKMFTNCRFGMMAWPIIVLSCAGAQQARTGSLSVAMQVALVLQLAYIFKFFLWEDGYLRTMDIMHDRAGFYICWGCLVWLPCVYTASTFYLVEHAPQMPGAVGAALVLTGLFAIAINYLADRQKQRFRASQGHCKVWGKTPKTIVAHYRSGDGREHRNLLLASGWWGISRHFHYVPEWIAAFCWTVPVGFRVALPHFYTIFLFILLTHRAARDDARCQSKYGDAWKQYRRMVPYRIMPGVY